MILVSATLIITKRNLGLLLQGAVFMYFAMDEIGLQKMQSLIF
jgi:hypothetical protein